MMPALFQPTRASPQPRQAKPIHTPPAPPSMDLSVISGSTVVVPELRNLGQHDIDFIDSVVKRAGPFATTFPVVFKAYNDLLKERGMDAGEIKYYGKLLKLGTMKGRNWGEKWDAVKRQHSQDLELTGSDHETVSTRVKTSQTPPYLQPLTFLPKLRDVDAETTPSEVEDIDVSTGVPQSRQTPNRFSSTVHPAARKRLGTQNAPPKPSMISSVRGLPTAFRGRPLTSDTSGSEAETIAPLVPDTRYSSISKGSQHVSLPRPRTQSSTHTIDFPRPLTSKNRFSGVRQSVIQSRSQDVADEEDAWNKIRMQQLEAEADRFLEERLLEQCWVVWRQSYQWIMMSQGQIDQARNTFLLKLTFHHWKTSLASRMTIYKDVAVLDDERRLCASLMHWRRRLREKQQASWRSDMRSKMKTMKDRQNSRILREAWSLWCRKYQTAFADQQYRTKLALWAFLKWKGQFRHIDRIEETAEQLVSMKEQRIIMTYWRNWQQMTKITGAERESTSRYQARIVWQAWSAWKKQTYDYRRATLLRDRNLRKRALSHWLHASQKVHALEVRADKHSARQDRILACAVLRVWLAHVRGREVDRQRERKVLYRAFLSWKKQMVQNRLRDERGNVFYRQTSKRVITTALLHWQTLCQSRRDAYRTATRFYDDRLVKSFGNFWLSQLREGIEERKRQKLIKKLQNRQAARVLYRWLLLTRKRRRCAQVETLLQERMHRRMGQNALSHWTQRVITMRERELYAIDVYNTKAIRKAWAAMQFVYTQHKENLKLLEDHLTLRKEDILRRFFHRWLATTRVTQHRRYILQIKEDEVKQMIYRKVWEQWRSNYLERRLRPLEIEMLMRSQQNLMYQAFSVWHAKARTRPAIVAVKFNAQRAKKKFYLKWREALPIAQKVREVRDNHDRLLLSRKFNEWLEAYRTKLVLKAVARARYLRLPTNRAPVTIPTSASPSSSASPPHESTPTKLYPIWSGSYVPRSITTQAPSNKVPTINDKEAQSVNDAASTGVYQRPSRLSRSPFGLGQGTGIVSLLRTNVHQNQQGKSDLSPPRPKFSFSNVTRHRGSSVNGVDSRGAGLSMFMSVNAESTPPNRQARSTASDDPGGRRALWNRLGSDRRIQEPSPSVTSQLTGSAPSSP